MCKLPSCHDFVMVGDATWDAIAAGRVGVPTVGLLSGGFGADLLAAGCRSVYADAADLAASLRTRFRSLFWSTERVDRSDSRRIFRHSGSEIVQGRGGVFRARSFSGKSGNIVVRLFLERRRAENPEQKLTTMAETVSDALLARLIDWGVDTIFGLPGDGINGFMEALRKRAGRVRFVHVRHEEVAAMAACGYAKFTGRLGVCLVDRRARARSTC